MAYHCRLRFAQVAFNPPRPSVARLSESEVMDLTYDAFVSYSRADKAFVERLVKHLERFAPPKALGLPARRLRVFMDTKDLVGTGYYDAVERALVSAHKLIVVCSPSSSKSPYVDDEIRRFLKAQDKTGRDIIPILLDGIPNNEARTPEQEAIKAFPEVLYDYIEMPLAVDYLRFDLRRSKFDDGAYANSWFTLLANILDVNRNELEEREAKRQRQRRLTIGVIAGTVMVALTVLSLVALWQRDEAVDQRQKAYARQLVAQAQLRLADTIAPPQPALKQAMAALQLASSKEAIEGLKTGIERLRPTHVSQLAMDEKDAVPADLAFSPNGEWVVGASESDIRVWRVSDGRRVFRQAVDNPMALRGFTADGQHVLYWPRKQDGKHDPPSTTSQLLVLEIQGHGDGFELKSHYYERILDAIISGHGLFALVANATGKRISVQDLLREETIGTLELRQAVVLGALDAKTGDTVIVDVAGNVRQLGYGLDTRKAEFKLPAGDRALAIGLMGGASSPPQMPMMLALPGAANDDVLITQRADKGLTIFSLRSCFKISHSGESRNPVSCSNEQILASARVKDPKTLKHLPTSVLAVRKLSPEQASDFQRFVAAGMLFAATGAQQGVNLFTLDGQLVTVLVHSRAKDWDVNLMGKIGRQDPIIDVGASDDGQTIVTGRKDGRVSVWRVSLSPRYGAWGAIPMPDMGNIAHFDHGAELGETVTWTVAPVLSVSGDGRYIASQSMGLDTNPVGGIERMNPLVRIWDVWQRKEIARFYPLEGIGVKPAYLRGGTGVTFAPHSDLLLTVSVTGTEKSRLDVWRLLSLRRSELGRRSMPPPYVSSPLFSNGVTVSPTGHRAVWVGADLRLRAWDTALGEVAVVDELAPVIERIFAAQSELFSKRANEHNEQNASKMGDLPPVANLLKSWLGAKKEISADFPVGIPTVISGNGCCALLAIGTTLRLYDLSNKGLLAERSVEDFVATSGPYGLGISNILLSDNGQFFLAAGTKPEKGNIELRVYSAAEKHPLKIMTVPIGQSPLAIDPKGRRLVLEKLDMQSKADPAIGPSRRLQIIDFRASEMQRELFAEQLTPSESLRDMSKTRSAAFSGDGRYIAIRQTEPACRSMRIANWVNLMPLDIPSCSGIKISYTVWDLHTGQQSAELEDVAESGFNPSLLLRPASENTGSVPGTAPSPWIARTDPEESPGSRNGNTRGLKAQKDAGTIIKFKEAARLYDLLVATSRMPVFTGFTLPGSGFMVDGDGAIVTTLTQLDTGSGSPFLVTRRLSFSVDSLIEEACTRLEPEHRVFSPAQWVSQFPGASFQPICGSTGAR